MKAIEAIEHALLRLSGLCDGAIQNDNVGFNGTDSVFGKSLATQVKNGQKLSERQLTMVLKMLKKYQKTQLVGINLPDEKTMLTELHFKQDVEKKIERRVVGIIEDYIKVEFDFNGRIHQAVKEIFPGGKYNHDKVTDDKYWLFHLEQLEDVCKKLVPLNFILDDSVKQELQNLKYFTILEKAERTEREDFYLEWYEENCIKWKYKPYEHQQIGIEWLVANRRCILADKPGVGKSLQSAIAAKCLQEFYKNVQDENVSIYVICPVSLRNNWAKEASFIKVGVEIFSYAKQPKPPENKKYIIIADEFHSYLENDKSSRTKNFYDLVLNENCLHLYLLSATPMSNGKPSNLYPALKCIRHPIALVKTQYEKKYCDAKATKFTKWDVTGASNLEELKNHISPYFLQRTKEECLDLPPKSYVSIECESTVNIEAQYQENIAWIKSEYFERVKQGTISGTAEKIVFLGYFRKFASIFKTHETIKMVEELIDANESVTVFTEFKDSAFMIAEHFGIEALTGDTKVDDRQQIVEDFQSGINKVFVGTIKSAGIGITLTKAAYNIIVDFPWKPSDLEQTEDRTHRIGQNRNVTIYNIFGKDIDYVMAAILGKKSELIDSVLSKKGIDMSKKDDDGFLDILINKLIQNS